MATPRWADAVLVRLLAWSRVHDDVLCLAIQAGQVHPSDDGRDIAFRSGPQSLQDLDKRLRVAAAVIGIRIKGCEM